MDRPCHRCKHFSADAFPMCAAPQRSNERIILAYLAKSGLYKDDCGPGAHWYVPARPSLLYRIARFLRGAA